jgi:hypothetical protein
MSTTDQKVDGLFWAIQTTIGAPKDDAARELAQSIATYLDETGWKLAFNPWPWAVELIVAHCNTSWIEATDMAEEIFAS